MSAQHKLSASLICDSSVWASSEVPRDEMEPVAPDLHLSRLKFWRKTISLYSFLKIYMFVDF